MISSTDISSRFWNLPQKADEEADREKLFIDDIIQKAHLEREILGHLEGVETVFDGGAGYGRFSILLARRGLHVTHFDLSRSIPGEVLRNMMREETQRRKFLDLCFWYDSQPWCVGMGKDNLVASAEKP